MSTVSVPFHFSTTFLVAVGAFAAVWLTLSRPQYAPRGWARVAFGIGWVCLAAAETLHGAQIIGSDVDGRLLVLRSGAYFFLLISLIVPVEEPPPSGTSTQNGRDAAARAAGRPGGFAGGSTGGSGPPGAWAMSGTLLVHTAGPAVLALGGAIAALRSGLQGARRLGLALALLGASELFFAHGGASSNPDAMWVLAHSLQLLGGIALGWWLWRAFRVSIQARFVTALVLVLILVIALVSSLVTQAFARNVSANAYVATGSDAHFVSTQLVTVSNNLKSAAALIAQFPPVVQETAARSVPVLNAAAAIFQNPARPPKEVREPDFVAFFAADGSQLGISAAAHTGVGSLLSEGEILELQGSSVVVNALSDKTTNAITDIGTPGGKLAVIAGAPIVEVVGNTSQLVGAVAVGQLVSTALIGSFQVGEPVTVLATDGTILANDLPSGPTVARKLFSQISHTVINDNQGLDVQTSVGASSYYVAVTPLHASEGQIAGPDQVAGQATKVVGAVMIAQLETPATQRSISRTLFLGALAATLFAVGAAMVSGTRITRPIRDLTAAAERVRQGDLSTRVAVEEMDEVGVLSDAFNQMTSSLDSLAGDLRESALEESRVRDELEAILQSMNDGLVAVDKAGRVMTVNREAERITGVSAERARGMDVEELLSVVDAAGSRVDLPIYHLQAGAAKGFAGVLGARELGVPVVVTSTLITNELGAASGAVAVLRDLTSDLEVEEMKTNFVSNISHELRTPLTPIKGYADLLRRKVVPRDKSVEFLNVIVSSTERMERLVDRLVDFSAMQARKPVLSRTPVNLERVVAELVAKAEDAGPAHTFVCTGLSGLPPVAGDTRLLTRAIDELLDNAVKFSPDGGPVVVHGDLDPANPARVRVSITDRGIGIPTEDMGRILQDFTQVDDSVTRSFGGLGLGLAYVRRIIEAHDGELRVASQVAKGSTFSLLIPRWRADMDGGGRGFPYRRPPREGP